MKKTLVVLIVFFVANILTGCAAFYGNEEQYWRGDWYGLAGSGEVARVQQDKLAIQKLAALPVNGEAVKGYKGIIENRSSRYSYTFNLIGPERKSYFLGPKQKTEDFLIPGIYAFEIKKGGDLVGWGQIRSGPQIHQYQKSSCHWFVYADK